MTAPRPLTLFALLLVSAALSAGCQQKMANAPYYRPLEPSEFFPDSRSNRPIEPHTIHRAQAIENDPLVTGWTGDEWKAMWDEQARSRRLPFTPVVQLSPDQERELAFGAPRYDQRPDRPKEDKVYPKQHKVYVEEFPFAITKDDLRRGAERYSIYCVECHGPMGNGKGKIWERGYLKPTSFHTHKIDAYEPDESGDVMLGYSRQYWRWGIKIPMGDVPHGYIFEVITKGFGGMGDYAAQIPPADRWRIIAYIRALQYSQNAELKDLPDEIKKQITEGEKKTEGGSHEH